MFGFVGLVTRLRYAVGQMGRCVPATAGFSSGKHIHVKLRIIHRLNLLLVTFKDYEFYIFVW